MSVVSHVPPFHPVADSLALAMAASSNAPVLLLDGELRVVAASDIFCQTFEIDVSRVTGRRLAELGDGEWGGRQIETLLKATASGSAEIDAYEMDLNRPSRETHHLVLHARKLAYGDEANVRLLLSITDVTQVRADERLKDDLLREKAILLRELQHRIANSLQIIASVLLQSARRVTSEETRGHLTDAHQRVMSVATMQRQLARTTLGEVELRPYLTELCQSISASMIRDTERMSLSVASDNARTSSDESISLGLIVTELVINSLKHAFPDGRPGRVSVDYRAQGNAWTLGVSDDGVGMRPDRHARAGLGTSIVEALAKQLKATITVADAQPGVRISIAHDGVPSQEENMVLQRVRTVIAGSWVVTKSVVTTSSNTGQTCHRGERSVALRLPRSSPAGHSVPNMRLCSSCSTKSELVRRLGSLSCRLSAFKSASCSTGSKPIDSIQ